MINIIKLLACLFMLIDHTGLILFDNVVALRLVGRLAMPLFAFCIARGFYYSKIKHTLNAYKKRMLLFAIASQIPYMTMVEEYKLNIGFLWLFCLLFLEIAEEEKKNYFNYLTMIIIVMIVFFIPMDYGFYGFLFTMVFYYFRIKKDSGVIIYISWIIIHTIRILISMEYGLIQLFTLPCFSIIDVFEKYDNRIRLNKKIFYWFYPVHIVILLIVKHIAS